MTLQTCPAEFYRQPVPSKSLTFPIPLQPSMANSSVKLLSPISTTQHVNKHPFGSNRIPTKFSKHSKISRIQHHSHMTLPTIFEAVTMEVPKVTIKYRPSSQRKDSTSSKRTASSINPSQECNVPHGYSTQLRIPGSCIRSLSQSIRSTHQTGIHAYSSANTMQLKAVCSRLATSQTSTKRLISATTTTSRAGANPPLAEPIFGGASKDLMEEPLQSIFSHNKPHQEVVLLKQNMTLIPSQIKKSQSSIKNSPLTQQPIPLSAAAHTNSLVERLNSIEVRPFINLVRAVKLPPRLELRGKNNRYKGLRLHYNKCHQAHPKIH